MDETARVEALAAILREFDLDAIKVRQGEVEIEVVRRTAQPVAMQYAAPPPVAAAPAGEQPAAGAAQTAPANMLKVKAPVVGIFYRSSAPGEDPFVEIGDRIEAGDTVCILEAMKIFNEITSDYGGKIARIVAENGELVAVGDDLFWVEP